MFLSLSCYLMICVDILYTLKWCRPLGLSAAVCLAKQCALLLPVLLALKALWLAFRGKERRKPFPTADSGSKAAFSRTIFAVGKNDGSSRQGKRILSAMGFEISARMEFGGLMISS
jgi:hypothetical protein